MVPAGRIELNLTELCNRTCEFCPRSTYYPNLNLNMSRDTLVEICEQIVDFNPNAEISITGRGEPLLHPNIVEFLETLHGYGLDIHLTTNGDHFYKFKNEPVFNKIHVLMNSYDSEQQMKDRMIRYPHFNHSFKTSTNFKQDNRGGSFDAPVDLTRPCHILYYKMFIDWDGTVNLCCNDWKYKVVVDSIHHNTIKNIWYNKLDPYRQQLAIGNRSCAKPCSECNASNRKGRLIYESL